MGEEEEEDGFREEEMKRGEKESEKIITMASIPAKKRRRRKNEERREKARWWNVGTERVEKRAVEVVSVTIFFCLSFFLRLLRLLLPLPVVLTINRDLVWGRKIRRFPGFLPVTRPQPHLLCPHLLVEGCPIKRFKSLSRRRRQLQ